MGEARRCCRCGAVVPEGAAGGLCPACGASNASSRLEPAADQPQLRNSESGETGPDQSRSTMRAAILETAGDRIGHYRLLQQIGEGGCGVVFLAEQEQPIKRRVAIKVVKPGMDTRQVLARFEAERQALAMMDHPNIAKVFDAGATEAGRPYFVMEWVRGIKLTEYCDRNHLSTGERLDLFIQICQAVQHAHQKGVIHRDIKPSNILVSDDEGVPVPKVIDFGIAKATAGHTLTDKTLFTAFEQFIGTPAYMSPEQAEMTSLDIDTRSDIYALGVLLYELLTGQTPLDQHELVAAGVDAMRRMILEKEPLRPSTRLSTLDAAERTAVARRRQSAPPQLIHLVRGDLDWIVMKCLEKDRTRRYSTAAELGTDVRRHLAHEPVSAGPPGAAYRARKFVRRHRAAVAVSGVAVLALVLAIIGTTVGLHRVRGAEQAARAEAEKAKAINVFLQGILGSANPAEGVGRDITVLEALKRAAGEIDDFFRGQPQVAAELKHTIGVTWLRLGHYDEAEPLLRSCLAYFEGVTGPARTNLAAALNSLAVVRHERGDYAEAESFYRRALALKEKEVGQLHPQSLMIRGSLSVLLRDKGDIEAAERESRRVIELRHKLPAADPVDLAFDLNNFGRVQQKKGDLAAAEETFEKAFKLLKTAGHPYQGVVLGNRAETIVGQGRLAEAATLYAEALEQLSARFGDANQDVAFLRAKYGHCALRLGQTEKAESLLLAALPVLRKTCGDRHERTRQAILDLAELYESLGKSDAQQYRALLKSSSAGKDP